ncbi:unnamed protein product [Sphagnum compactum]
MPDQVGWKSHHIRSNQLQQLQECTTPFICRTCGSDIRTSHWYANCCSTSSISALDLLPAGAAAGEEEEAAATGVLVIIDCAADNTTSNSKPDDKIQSALALDHVGVVSKLPVAEECRGKAAGEDAAILSSTATVASKPAAVFAGECFEPWVQNVETTRGSRTDDDEAAVHDAAVFTGVPVFSLTDEQQLKALRSTALPADDAKDQAADVEAASNVAAIQTTVSSCRTSRPRPSSSSCMSRRLKRERGESSATSVKKFPQQNSSTVAEQARGSAARPQGVAALENSETEIPNRRVVAAPAADMRISRRASAAAAAAAAEINVEISSSGQTAIRSQKQEEHAAAAAAAAGYNGVRTREGVRGFLVEIRPPRWKKTIWLGTYDTAIEAAAAHDAGVFYTNKPKRKYNLFHNINPALCLPPLPAHLNIRDSSPQAREDIKNFVKEQAASVASQVHMQQSLMQKETEYGNYRCCSSNSTRRACSRSEDVAIHHVLPPMQASTLLPTSDRRPEPMNITTVVDVVSEQSASSSGHELPSSSSCSYESDFNKILDSSLSSVLTSPMDQMDLGLNSSLTNGEMTTVIEPGRECCLAAAPDQDPSEIWISSSHSSSSWLPEAPGGGVFEAHDPLDTVLFPASTSTDLQQDQYHHQLMTTELRYPQTHHHANANFCFGMPLETKEEEEEHKVLDSSAGINSSQGYSLLSPSALFFHTSDDWLELSKSMAPI